MSPDPNPSETAPGQWLSIAAAMELATGLHRAGRLAEAGTIYTRVLAVAPDHPDALHFSGLLAHDEGRAQEARDRMARSVERCPGDAGFRSNFGNLLLDQGRFEEAERQYRQALDCDPDRPDTLHNYAVLCKALGRLPEAEQALLRALELVPDFIEARNALASLYVQLGRIGEAVTQACEASVRAPHNAHARELLAYAHCRLGQLDEAARIYREWLAAEPDNPKARHHLAACTGEAVPPRASDAYVQATFDSFAQSFDARLEVLQYRAPSLVGEAVAADRGPPAGDLEVLDAGCGTGLCAPLIRPFARTLTGVDLSQGMLDKARRRTLYDALHQAELGAFMRAHQQQFDLIVCADTLVYFGVLDEVLAAAAESLRPGGTLCFTLEALPDAADADFRLQEHGRYAHRRTYVATLLARTGLKVEQLGPVVLRQEVGSPVHGWLVLARTPTRP